MKDIFEILKESGIEVEADKQADIRRVFAENYKTINEHNQKFEKLTEQVNNANTAVAELKSRLEKAESVDVEALKQKISEFEAAEQKRKDDEAAENELKALKERFSSLKGDKKFLNEGTESWMFGEFKKALELEENKSKSDAEIYEAVTRDKNIYENPNQVVIPPAKASGDGNDSQRTATLMKAMGLKSKGE